MEGELYRTSRTESCVKKKHYMEKGHGGPDVPPLFLTLLVGNLSPKNKHGKLVSKPVVYHSLRCSSPHCNLNCRETPRLRIPQLLQWIKSSPSFHHHKHLYHIYFCRHPMVNMEYLKKFSKRSGGSSQVNLLHFPCVEGSGTATVHYSDWLPTMNTVFLPVWPWS
nr:PREDICTED: uncharacterized protein LOC108953071 [Musa acuminata subsp. malaccensis]